MSVARQRRGDRARRRAEIRNRLVAAAEQLTAGGESYSAVTIERLASMAAISRATFYTYFDSKADVLGAWFAEKVEELAEACSAWRGIGAASSEEDLATALTPIVRTYTRHATLLAAVSDEATRDSGLRTGLDDAIERGIAALRDHIEQGQRDGWIDPELLPAETAAWAIWMLQRVLDQVLAGASRAQTAKLTRTLAGMAWHTLYRSGSGRRPRNRRSR
jgi:TetR/AcrR family transcriptional regulator, ethionamide resistance regulator